MWIQEKVAECLVRVIKVDTKDNLADALTKNVKAEDLTRHVDRTNQVRIRTDRSGLEVEGQTIDDWTDDRADN